MGFFPHLAVAGWTPWFYLYKALVPFNLTVIYPRWHIDASRWLSYMPGMPRELRCIVVVEAEIMGPALSVRAGLFRGDTFPVMGFFDQGLYADSLVADHWQYYSIVGVIALAVAGGEKICRRLGKQVDSWRRWRVWPCCWC